MTSRAPLSSFISCWSVPVDKSKQQKVSASQRSAPSNSSWASFSRKRRPNRFGGSASLGGRVTIHDDDVTTTREEEELNADDFFQFKVLPRTDFDLSTETCSILATGEMSMSSDSTNSTHTPYEDWSHDKVVDKREEGTQMLVTHHLEAECEGLESSEIFIHHTNADNVSSILSSQFLQEEFEHDKHDLDELWDATFERVRNYPISTR